MNYDLNLKGEARKVYTALVKNYHIIDKTKLMLVRTAATSWATILKCEAQVEKDGIIVLDRYGNEKSHPANDLIRQSKDQLLRALKQLDIVVEHEEPDFIKDFGIKY